MTRFQYPDDDRSEIRRYDYTDTDRENTDGLDRLKLQKPICCANVPFSNIAL